MVGDRVDLYAEGKFKMEQGIWKVGKCVWSRRNYNTEFWK